MATSPHIEQKCLGLGPSSIGLKTKNVGGDVIDDIAKQKLGELKGMIEKIENYLKDRFPEVYDNKIRSISNNKQNNDYDFTSFDKNKVSNSKK